MQYLKNYEMVIGLEVHVELGTKTKIFCSCPTTFGAEPNTQVCPICLAMPGTLPVLNKEVVEYAIKAGLALNCDILRYSKEDRKNYVYPDLSKAYQISQQDLPLCKKGHLDIETESGTKRIGITRIHIEEDAGKLIHSETLGTLVDYNRGGVPLIEIVSEPDLRSAEEVIAYLKKLRAIIMYTGVSECKMNEGSFRCDVNLSIRKIGSIDFGTRVEMKNLNSFQFISKAIEYEYKRQVEAIESGEKLVQETRKYDQTSGKTFSMRKKEDANDYRYFPDPDLPPIISSEEFIESLKNQIPMLPDERKAEYVSKYYITNYDAELLVNDKEISDYFEKAVSLTSYPKTLANIIISDLLRLLPQDSTEIPVPYAHIASLAEKIGSGDINSSIGKKVLKAMVEEGVEPLKYIAVNDLSQINDKVLLENLIRTAIKDNPKSLEDYKAGKKAAIKSVVGAVMSKTGGKGNPVIINELLDMVLETV